MVKLALTPNPLIGPFVTGVFNLLEKGQLTNEFEKLSDFIFTLQPTVHPSVLITLLEINPDYYAHICEICRNFSYGSTLEGVTLTSDYVIDLAEMLQKGASTKELELFDVMNRFGLWHGEKNEHNRQAFGFIANANQELYGMVSITLYAVCKMAEFPALTWLKPQEALNRIIENKDLAQQLPVSLNVRAYFHKPALNPQNIQIITKHFLTPILFIDMLRIRLEAFLKDIGESPSYDFLENSQYSAAGMIQQAINSQDDLHENDLLLKAIFEVRDSMQVPTANDPHYDAFLNDVQDAFLPAEKRDHHNPQFKHECKTILSHLARYADGSSLVDVLKRLPDIDPGVCTMLCDALNYLQEEGRKEDEGVGHEEYQEIAAAVYRYIVEEEFKSDFFLIIAGLAGSEGVCELLKGAQEKVRESYNLLVGDVAQDFHKQLLIHLCLNLSEDVGEIDQLCYQDFITCLTTEPQYENARNQFKQLGIEINSLLLPKEAVADYATVEEEESPAAAGFERGMFGQNANPASSKPHQTSENRGQVFN